MNILSKIIGFILFSLLYVFSVWVILSILSDIFSFREFSFIEVGLILLLYNIVNFKIFTILDYLFISKKENDDKIESK